MARLSGPGSGTKIYAGGQLAGRASRPPRAAAAAPTPRQPPAPRSHRPSRPEMAAGRALLPLAADGGRGGGGAGGAGRARPRIPGIAAPEPGPRYRRGPQSAVPSFPERQHGRAAPPCPGKCRPPPPPRPRPTGAAQPRGEPRSSIPPPADVPVSPRRCPRRS